MQKRVENLSFKKETQSTYVYGEEANDTGLPGAVPTLYIRKFAMGKTPPQRITLTLEDAVD